MNKHLLLACILSVTMILNNVCTVSVLASDYGLPDNAEQVEVKYENGWPVIYYLVTPGESQETTHGAEEKTEIFEKQQRLTEPPQEGVTLAKILKEGDGLDTEYASSYEEAYSRTSIGECAWYAYGRFREVHGIWLPIGEGMGGIKNWLDNVYLSNEIKADWNIEDVPEQSIAVFVPRAGYESLPGHVCFIEYVERDNNGKPTEIYFTEANGAYDLNKGKYDIGYDGIVTKQSYDEFKNKYMLELMGYIVPNQFD